MGKRQFGSIRTLPSDRYQARYQDSYGYRHVRTFTTKADANAWLSSEQTDRRRGLWVDPSAGDITFGEYAPTWLDQRFDLRPRTLELYEGLLRLHLMPTFEKIPLGDLSPAVIRNWHARLHRADRPSPNTVAKAYRLLKTILGTAVVDELIPRNPCLIKGASVERTAERTPATINEVYALAGAIDDRYRVLILLAAFTGLRWGELIALTRKHIDLESATVRVVEQYVELKDGSRVLGPPKSEAGVRTVAVPPHIIEELGSHIDRYGNTGKEGLVFPSPDGQPLRRSNFYRRIYQPAAKKAGLPTGFRFHDLRHTGNTLAASTGASTRELMARLGHASPRAALIYQHATASRDQLIAQSISDMVGTRSGPKGSGVPAAEDRKTTIEGD
jgi:integrase